MICNRFQREKNILGEYCGRCLGQFRTNFTLYILQLMEKREKQKFQGHNFTNLAKKKYNHESVYYMPIQMRFYR